jgi:ppGpp synthetase/RelA/SpoT-type nucleotidyltranferase
VEDLEHARTRWLKDETVFAAFGRHLEVRLQAIVRAIGIPCTVTARTKEIDSLLKKLIRKPDHTYASLGDKLGARIVAKRLGDVTMVCPAIAREFACGPFENTADRLAEDQVGYLSVHVDISLLPSDLRINEFPRPGFALNCKCAR